MILPAGEDVKVGLDLVELGADAEPGLAELRRLDTDFESDDGVLGGGLGELGIDLRGAEDLEVEERLGRLVDVLGGVRVPLGDVHRAAERALFDLLRARSVAVGIEADDRDLPERAERARGDLEDVVGGAGGEIDRCVGVDHGVGVAAVGQHTFQITLGLLVGVLVEARPRRQRLVGLRGHGRSDLGGEGGEAVDRRAAVAGRRPLLDEDVDADVVRGDLLHPPGAGVCLEEPFAAGEALDPGHVALQDARVVDLVVVDDAAKDPRELRRRRRGHPIGDVVRVDRVGPFDEDVVDARTALGDRGATSEEDGERRDRRDREGASRVH